MTCLGCNTLAELTLRWESWEAEVRTPSRRQARARLHLVFLLIRYGGLRLGEVLELDARTAINTVTGMVHVGGAYERDILLPVVCMRHIRRILEDEKAQNPDFLKFDQGFVRKKFYDIAAPLGLDQAMVGPRALRYARGLELLEQHIPFNLVQKFLGQTKASQIAAFLSFSDGKAQRLVQGALGGKGGAGGIYNSFIGIVGDIQPGVRMASVSVQTFSDVCITALCPIRDFLKLELRPGLVVSASVDPAQMVLMPRRSETSLANCLQGRVAALYRDFVESFVDMSCPDGTRFRFALDTQMLERLHLDENKPVHVAFPARAVHLQVD